MVYEVGLENDKTINYSMILSKFYVNIDGR